MSSWFEYFFGGKKRNAKASRLGSRNAYYHVPRQKLWDFTRGLPEHRLKQSDEHNVRKTVFEALAAARRGDTLYGAHVHEILRDLYPGQFIHAKEKVEKAILSQPHR